MKFLIITNDPSVASIAHSCGINRVMIDLELMKKNERQGKLDTFITTHRSEDISIIRKAAPDCELLVRLNPLYAGSKDEIDHAINSGADFIMQPYFSTANAVEQFSALINGRCGFIPLVEHIQALDHIEAILDVRGITEVYLGLNDLNISRSGKFMFKAFPDGLVDRFADAATQRNIPFGIGGIGAVGKSKLPAEVILPEHKRVGSTRVILGRAFQEVVTGGGKLVDHRDKLGEEVSKLSAVMQSKYSIEEFDGNRQRMEAIIREIEALIK
jgi:hypothetical protein